MAELASPPLSTRSLGGPRDFGFVRAAGRPRSGRGGFKIKR
jgi:hypothetical protein